MLDSDPAEVLAYRLARSPWEYYQLMYLLPECVLREWCDLNGMARPVEKRQ
ncbi:MAG: hypothetical protein KKB13_27835 [Chloroflexi bacterium]|nr:hypothetical protein [Chloroflexota bacterium]